MPKKLKLKKPKKTEKIEEITGILEGEIKIVDIDSVVPHPDNPRNNEKGIPKLMKLLKLNKQITPIVVWIKNNFIYKGNTVYAAMKNLKYDRIRVQFVDFPDEETAMAYLLSDNIASEWSRWNKEKLAKIITEKFEKVERKNLKKLTGLREGQLKSIEMFNEPPAAYQDQEDIIVETVNEFSIKVTFPDFAKKRVFLNKIDPKNESSGSISIDTLMKHLSWKK